MTHFLEVVAVAFGYQLAVLPGEKVQLLIAALSTRFDPLVVVSAAGSVFAGWTVLEILVGELLQRVLPGFVLTGLSGGLFLLFAVLLFRSAPPSEFGSNPGTGPEGQTSVEELDGTIFGLKRAGRFGVFLPIFMMMAVGEFGDKTQLITLSLAGKYGAHPGIWVGEMLAIMPISTLNAYTFHYVLGRTFLRKAHLFGATLFLFFGFDTFLALLTGISPWEWLVGTLIPGMLGLVM